jgi:hypothetical protein
MNRSVDVTAVKLTLQLPGEQTFASDLRQWSIEDTVTLGGDDFFGAFQS